MPEQLDRDLMERYLAGTTTNEELARARRLSMAYPAAWSAIHTFRDRLDGSADSNIQVNTERSLNSLKQRMGTKGAGARPPIFARNRYYAWAAIGITAIIIGVKYVPVDRSTSLPAPFREHTTQPGRISTLRLTDGTRIVLAPGSRVRYAADFGKARREIFLEGESYFDVRPDAARPFTVFAGNSSTQVLGTSFAVRRYIGDDHVRVAVTSGKVALSGAGVLSDGDVGTLTDSGIARVLRKQDTGAIVAWTEGRLTFSEARLDDVLADLSRWYNVEFIVETPTLRTQQITITFDRLSRDAMLNDLAVLLSARYTMDGATVRLARL